MPVETDGDFRSFTPELLLPVTFFFQFSGRTYDVSPDGKRFLMITPPGGSTEEGSSPSVVMVENWFEELKRLVPTD